MTTYDCEHCPNCGNLLDTGWECDECGYDASWIGRIFDQNGGAVEPYQESISHILAGHVVKLLTTSEAIANANDTRENDWSKGFNEGARVSVRGFQELINSLKGDGGSPDWFAALRQLSDKLEQWSKNQKVKQ